MPLTAKICGLSESDQIQTCINYGASMCGYILFYPKSHRNLNLDKAKELTSLKHSKSNVAVMVNPSRVDLESIKDFNFHYYQIYGILVMHQNEHIHPKLDNRHLVIVDSEILKKCVVQNILKNP